MNLCFNRNKECKGSHGVNGSNRHFISAATETHQWISGTCSVLGGCPTAGEAKRLTIGYFLGQKTYNIPIAFRVNKKDSYINS